MNFVDELGNAVDTNQNERDEQIIASHAIAKGAKVLELGARYGTVTCLLSRSVGPDGAVVSVEPDATVWSALSTNLAHNKCAAKVLQGFLSAKPLKLSGSGYATHAVAAETSEGTFSVADATEAAGIDSFNTLVADCEGCLETFFAENPTFVESLHTVAFEADRPDACNYASIVAMLKTNGFSPVVIGFQNVWIKNRSLDSRSLSSLKAVNRSHRLPLFPILLLFLALCLAGIAYYAQRKGNGYKL